MSLPAQPSMWRNNQLGTRTEQLEVNKGLVVNRDNNNLVTDTVNNKLMVNTASKAVMEVIVNNNNKDTVAMDNNTDNHNKVNNPSKAGKQARVDNGRTTKSFREVIVRYIVTSHK